MTARSDHKDLLERIDKLGEQLDALTATVEPIANTYKTASTIGRWGMGFLVFLSVTLGAIIELRKLIRK